MEIFYKNQNKLFLILLLLITASTSACVAPKQYKTFSLNYDQSLSTADISKNIEIKINPVTFPKLKEHQPLYASTKYGLDSGSYIIPADITICDLPAFHIEMTNKTGHVIKFPGNVIIKAQTSSGTVYNSVSKFSLLNEMTKWEKSENESGIYWNTAPARQKISDISILDEDTTLLPGIPHNGYLMFNFPTNSRDEYVNFMGSISQIKILIFELPISMDEAGKSIKTQNLIFVYDIKTNEIAKQ